MKSAQIDSELPHRSHRPPQRWYTQKNTILTLGLVTLILGGAIAIRLTSLDAKPFWVDEAESSINALTILQDGFPTDSYLGLPIYENTLVKRWPGNPEYEFRDISYTEEHFAVYHGWLPLYAIAASFAIQSIHPDEADGELSIKHGLSEWRHRTKAARLPAVLFGTAFLLIAFYAATSMYGRDAGWAALTMGAIHPWHVMLSREARYYSAQITLTTACCFLLWLMLQHCTWKRTCAAALAFILLFYTHLLSFCTAGAVFLIVLPAILRLHRPALGKMIAFASIVLAGTLPWVIVTGFYAYQSGVPRAWPMLHLPADIYRYPPVTLPNAVVGTAVVLSVVWLLLPGSHISPRLRAPAAPLAPALLLLGGWAALGYAAFLLFMPAVSFATNRLNLSYWGPLFLLESMICAAFARVLIPRFSVFLAPVLMVLLFFAGGNTLLRASRSTDTWEPLELVSNRLAAMHLNSDTKLYAAPNGHLILTFYSGLPIQDITPIRKSYLDTYRGDVVYIDYGISVDADVLTPERVRQAALRYGMDLSPDAAARWVDLLRTRDYREAMLKIVNPGAGDQLEMLPPFARQLLRLHDRGASLLFSKAGLDLVTKGFDIYTWTDWRAVLKYRFVDPAAHSGVHANYADRLNGADFTTLPEADTVIYYSRWHPPQQASQSH
jgi:hypothetical protein